MRRYRWLFVALAVIAVAAGGLALLPNRGAVIKPQLLDLSALQPYVTKEDAFYWDRSEFLKGVPVGNGVDYGFLRTPLFVRQLRLQNVPVSEIRRVVARMTSAPGWTIQDDKGRPKDTTGFAAYEGTTFDPSAHSIRVLPNENSLESETERGKSLGKDFVLIETCEVRISRNPIARLENLGRDPFRTGAINADDFR